LEAVVGDQGVTMKTSGETGGPFDCHGVDPLSESCF
jgi:hypothetical protein